MKRSAKHDRDTLARAGSRDRSAVGYRRAKRWRSLKQQYLDGIVVHLRLDGYRAPLQLVEEIQSHAGPLRAADHLDVRRGR